MHWELERRENGAWSAELATPAAEDAAARRDSAAGRGVTLSDDDSISDAFRPSSASTRPSFRPMHALIPESPSARRLIRTVVVYAFLLIGLRLAGKRELSQLNPFDLVVLLLLSNTVQNAIIGNDNSLIGGLAGAAALLVINAIVVRLLFRLRQARPHRGKARGAHPQRPPRSHAPRSRVDHRRRARVGGPPAGHRVTGPRERMPPRDRRRAVVHRAASHATTRCAITRSLGMLGQIEARQRAMLEQFTALERKIAGTTGTHALTR